MKKIIYILTIVFAIQTQLKTNAQLPGTLDATFATAGSFILPFVPGQPLYVPSMKVGLDGKITFGGHLDQPNADMVLLRLNADGTPDVFFGNGGKTQIDASLGASDIITDIHIQSDGKTVITGYSILNGDFQMFVGRLLLDGSFDPSFNNGMGFRYLMHNNNNTMGSKISVDASFNVVVLAEFVDNGVLKMIVYRFNSNGELDNSFSGDGKKEIFFSANPDDNENPHGLKIGAGNKVYVMGSSNTTPKECLIAKLNSNGEYDNTFDGDGKSVIVGDVNTEYEYNDFVIDQAGNIWVGAGSTPSGDVLSWMFFKVNANGTIDNTFGTNGRRYYTPSPNIELTNTINMFKHGGAIVLGGSAYSNNSNVVITGKISDAGVFDNTYGTQGFATTTIGNNDYAIVSGIGVQASGKIIIGGSVYGQGSYQPWASRLFNSETVSINEVFSQQNDLYVYPNPAATYFQISTASQHANIGRIHLVNITGQTVATWNINQAQYQLPENLPSGNYFLRIENGKEMSKHTLIITK